MFFQSALSLLVTSLGKDIIVYFIMIWHNVNRCAKLHHFVDRTFEFFGISQNFEPLLDKFSLV